MTGKCLESVFRTRVVHVVDIVNIPDATFLDRPHLSTCTNEPSCEDLYAR